MLVATLAACAGEPPVPPTPPPPPPATDPPPPPPPVIVDPPAAGDFRGQAGIGWNPLDYGGAFEAFDNHVTIQIGTFDRGRDDAPPIPENYYTKWVNEYFGGNLNVTVEYIPIERGDTMTAYNLLFAAGTPPTMLMEYDWPKVTEWWGEGALQPINLQEFVNIAPTWFQNAGGQEKFDSFVVGGDYMFAPALRPFWDTNYTWVTFFRLDWYEEQGLSLPTSWEEWVEAQVIFKEAYNLPYTLDRVGFTNNFQFYNRNPWPLNEEHWVMHSDVNVPSLPAEGARRVLKQDNELYNLGLINPEFELDEGGAAGVQTQALQEFINGNLYRHSFFVQPSMPDLEAFYENNPDAKLGIMYNNTVQWWEADANGFSTHPQDRATNPAGFFLCFSEKATPDQLKAAYMYLEWMAQPDVLDHFQWGAEGVTYNIEDGARKPVPWEDQGDMWMGFSSNKDYWAVVVEVRAIGTAEDTVQAIVPGNLPESVRLRQEMLDRYAYLRVRADAGLTYADPFFGVPIKALPEYTGTLVPLFQQFATALVKANPDDFEGMYADYVAQYRAAGFEAIEQERLAAYKAGLSTVLGDVAAGRAPFVWYDHKSVIPRVYQ